MKNTSISDIGTQMEKAFARLEAAAKGGPGSPARKASLNRKRAERARKAISARNTPDQLRERTVRKLEDEHLRDRRRAAGHDLLRQGYGPKDALRIVDQAFPAPRRRK